jgi:hypothetical protein
LDRREFIQLAGLASAGVAGVVFSSGLRGVSFAAEKGRAEDRFEARAVLERLRVEFPENTRLRRRLARADASPNTNEQP